MLDGVTIEQLRTFLAVVEAGSFTAAARSLGRVQAAVSQSIDRLEAQLGLRLFDRTGRVPRLTQHGEAVVALARRVEGDVEALDALVTSLKQGRETQLRVVVDVHFPTESLVVFAREFGVAHPSVELVLFTEVLSAVTAHVRERRATWGIAVEDADLRELDHRVIAAVRLVPVAAPSHALAGREAPLGVSDLADSVQIVLSEHRGESERDPDDHGVFSPRTWRVVDVATKRALIVGGLGWGHLPEHIVREDLREGRLVELALEAWGSAPLRRSLVLVQRPDGAMGPVARWAIERLWALCRAQIEGKDPGDAEESG